ncbi:MAG: histidinol-phosphate transaminase [Acidobacteriota bacterium]
MNALRPALRTIRPYTLRSETARVRLNRNESPFDWPQDWKRQMLARALERPWCRYPEFVPQDLIRKLAGRWNWPEEGVVVGNGSNELLQALILATLEPGRRVLTVEPTFVLYAQQAAVAGAEVQVELFGEGWQYDVARLIERLRKERPTVLILCSPNNPTGSWLEPEALAGLAAAVPETLIVLDEAYGEFAGWSAAQLEPRAQNLVLLKTFSKAAGLAGLRIGYLLASCEIARAVGRVKVPYSVDFFSALVAGEALERRTFLEERVGRIVSERQRLQEGMGRIAGVRVFPSKANFLLFDVDDPQRVFSALVARDVLVRDVSGGHPLLAHSLRVTVGLPEENDLFVAALREAMEERR